MAITAVDRIKGGRSSTKNRLHQRFYVQRFRVQTDSPTVGQIAVRSAVDPTTGLAIPSIGDTFDNGTETDLGSFAETDQIEEESSDGKSWIVTINYGPYDATEFSENPLDWKPKVSYGAQKFERILEKDEDGNPVINSAGCPFKDPLSRDDSRPTITIVRNMPITGTGAYDEDVAGDFRDSINSVVWNGYPVKTVKCESITTSEPQYDSNARIWYYVVTYVFSLNRDTWVKYLLDQGFAEWDATAGKLKPILYDGQQITESALLDGSGSQLAHGGTPVYLPFKGYKEQDFTSLALDISTSLGH